MITSDKHKKSRLTLVKSVRIRSYSGPYFPASRLNTEGYCLSVFSTNVENIDQTNSEYGHFSRKFAVTLYTNG